VAGIRPPASGPRTRSSGIRTLPTRLRALAAGTSPALGGGHGGTMSAQDKKQKAIAEAIKVIHKQFGSGSLMRLDGSEVGEVGVGPTGSIALDVALGCGGLPRGRIVEIYGPESSGKTTLTLHAIAEAQRAGGVCAFIDAEHALDTEYARRLGVQLD